VITEKVTVRNPEGEEVREERQQEGEGKEISKKMLKKGLLIQTKKTREKVPKSVGKPKGE
jgi:hypothetical protein